MDEPFELSFAEIYPGRSCRSILCSTLLREIPGQRKVYAATWQQTPAIVKLFTSGRGKRHTRREWKGLCELQKRHILSPVPLFYGRTENGQWAVATAKICGCESARHRWQKAPNPEAQLSLLRRVFGELANYHDKGILQRDLHLDNFLICDRQLYLLDPGQIEFQRRPLARRASLEQLALLLSQLPEMEERSLLRLCQEYSDVRSWTWREADTRFLQRESKRLRDRLMAKTLKKYLRSNSRHKKIATHRIRAVLDRGLFRGRDPWEFLDHIDRRMDEGTILKRGNTCYVSRFTWNGKDLVVKRYNHKGLWHSFRHTIKKSRAYHCWLHSHRLLRLYIPAPHPWAYVERRKFGLIHSSYFVMEHITGAPLLRALTAETEQKQLKIAAQVRSLLQQFDKNLISHGDLKHQNFLITDDGPMLIDLDGTRFHRWQWRYRSQKSRDMRRFFKNWQESPQIRELFLGNWE